MNISSADRHSLRSPRFHRVNWQIFHLRGMGISDKPRHSSSCMALVTVSTGEPSGCLLMMRMFVAEQCWHLMKCLLPSYSSQDGLSLPSSVPFPLYSDNGSLTRIPPQLRHVSDVILGYVASPSPPHLMHSQAVAVFVFRTSLHRGCLPCHTTIQIQCQINGTPYVSS